MAKYFGGGSGGGGGGGVTSFNARTGAVVPAANDYSASQIANDSGVPGSGLTVATALAFIFAAIPAAVTVAGTAPITVAGGPAYTVSIADLSNASKGVPAAITASNAVLTSNGGGTAATWVAISGGGSPVGTTRAINTTAPLAGGGDLSADRTFTVADVSTTSKGVAPILGAAGTILASNGVVASWQTALTAPASPGDDGKVVIASGGNFTYLAGSVTGQALTWSGTAWAAGTNFGANLVTNSAGLQTTGAVGASFISIGLSGAGAGNAASTGNFRIQNQFTCKGRLLSGADITVWDFGLTTADTMTINGLSVAGALFSILGGSAFTAGAFTIGQSTIQLSGGAPVIFVKDTVSAGAFVAVNLIIRGSNDTGAGTVSPAGSVAIRAGDSTNATGGALSLRPGNGAVAQGVGTLLSGVGTVKFTWSNIGLGLYGATAITQQTRVGQLTDSTTGTPSNTLVDVTTTAVADPAKVNNNFSSVLTKLNALDVRLSQAGGGIGITA